MIKLGEWKLIYGITTCPLIYHIRILIRMHGQVRATYIYSGMKVI